MFFGVFPLAHFSSLGFIVLCRFARQYF